MKMTSFAISPYGQCCRRHFAGQRIVRDINVLHIVVEIL